jgi:hypothetical protein
MLMHFLLLLPKHYSLLIIVRLSKHVCTIHGLYSIVFLAFEPCVTMCNHWAIAMQASRSAQVSVNAFAAPLSWYSLPHILSQAVHNVHA